MELTADEAKIMVVVNPNKDLLQSNEDDAHVTQEPKSPEDLHTTEHAGADSGGEAGDDQKHFSSIHQGEHVSTPAKENIAGGKSGSEETSAEEAGTQAPKQADDAHTDTDSGEATFNVPPSSEIGEGAAGGGRASTPYQAAADVDTSETATQVAQGGGGRTAAQVGEVEDVNLGAVATSPEEATPAEKADLEESTVVAEDVSTEDDTPLTFAKVTDDQVSVADAPSLSVSNTSGDEDSAIALNISASLTDVSETLSISISGIPNGAILSAGTQNNDGSYTLTAEQLDGLSITPPTNSNTDFDLTVTATSTDGNSTAMVTGDMHVDVNAVADTPTLSTSDVSGTEGSAIALDMSAALADTDGSESLSVTVSGVPEGASLSAGIDNNDGTWTLTGEQLGGLEFNAPEGGATYTLTATAISTESDGDIATQAANFDVTAFNVIEGTDTIDIITGTDAPDKISGFAGKDTLSGGAGDDELYGGAGKDTLIGGAGDDTLYGGAGKDTLTGGAGADQLFGEEGDDTFIFGAGEGGTNDIDGGAGSWIDTIQLSDATQAPTASLQGEGSWTLQVDNDTSYTVDNDAQTITFDDGDASGSITLNDGSQVDFSNIDKIEW